MQSEVSFRSRNLDVVFLSYDEPNAEANWRNLRECRRDAKRIHGVTGIDAAHRAVGHISGTENVFVVDGDTTINPDFWDMHQALPLRGTVLSWASRNVVNGLTYGNGGLKCWPTAWLRSVVCHENGATDFFTLFPYHIVGDCIGVTACNGSPLQAFRAGFREGIRLAERLQALATGEIGDSPNTNFRRLQNWWSVGLHERNGSWAILGARAGSVISCDPRFSSRMVNSYSWIYRFWRISFSWMAESDVLAQIDRAGTLLSHRIGVRVPLYSVPESAERATRGGPPQRHGLLTS